MNDLETTPKGFIPLVVKQFLNYRLSILFLVFAMAAGVVAVLITPREEEPQIVVPMADVFVHAPGATAQEVEKLVATPLERLLWQIEGVEYVYSMSRRDMAVVTVRFFVGEHRENSLVKLHNKIAMNIDAAPPLVRGWVIKPVEIDDVPILNLTLHSERYNDHALHRIGEEVLARLAEVPDISRTGVVGGRAREVRVEVLPENLAAFGISLLQVVHALEATDAAVTAGTIVRNNHEITVTSDAFVADAREVENLVVGVHDGKPVYLRDLGAVSDSPEEPVRHARFGLSYAEAERLGLESGPVTHSAVTLALAKKRGTNAVDVARNILERMETLKKTVIPDGVEVVVTRNYGRTAQQKVDELLSSLVFAILTVVGLLALTLGWRESLVVAVAVPLSFALALFVNYLFGFTINRVTLFALILSLGLVVDDPIINVDNIQRHILAGRRKPDMATLFAVKEVLPPVIMSTLAIIVSFTPLFFITGMMGPYMAPMAANVPLTVSFSTVCALTVVPWLSWVLIRKRAPQSPGEAEVETDAAPGWIRRVYRRITGPFLASRPMRWALALAVVLLLCVSAALALFRQVPLKMLPFDNKDEFQVVIDMPEGTPLEATDRVVRAFEDYLREVPEVTHFVSYVGTGSPMDFNGMVRHYYLRETGNLADIRVNLADKKRRVQQSHTILLRIRKDLEDLARREGAHIKLVEVPPGPPVLSTIVTEIYGTPDQTYAELIMAGKQVQEVMAEEPFVVDIDDSTETPRQRLDFQPDKAKAALHGVSTHQIAQTLRTALEGGQPATVHLAGERQPLSIRIVMPKEKRSDTEHLAGLPILTAEGTQVPLGELGVFKAVAEDQPIYHKNLERVVFVYAETAGRPPATAILDMQGELRKKPLPDGIRAEWAGEGEWKITLDVFRDLGIAYAAAMLGIYILLVIQMSSFFLPLLIMISVPLTLIGIMPGFWFLNLAFAPPVEGFQNPVFFTATSMIGMIALGGIVIRNSLVLIEFIQDALKQGVSLKDAVLESGAARMRPILLTAATTALGAWPITLDPIFSGLAWALIFGLVASTFFTLVVVPVAFYALNLKTHRPE
ncbi:efflux RND transporter permease subunit [Desulfatiglans anilini]|uniref:efflux RND transporter permease subunit n=1 Tax=Desulfatiglans anilini TaxID=90728 RepID=UPI000427A2F6|nr:efflux RND transporter permease subunit [Desulfatiglans anilini]